MKARSSASELEWDKPVGSTDIAERTYPFPSMRLRVVDDRAACRTVLVRYKMVSDIMSHRYENERHHQFIITYRLACSKLGLLARERQPRSAWTTSSFAK